MNSILIDDNKKKWLPIGCLTCDMTGISESMGGTKRLCTRCGGSLLIFVHPFGIVLLVKKNDRKRWKYLRKEGTKLFIERK